MKVEVGQTLVSVVDSTAVVVVRAPAAEVALTCGGSGMVVGKPGAATGPADTGAGTVLGKRYVDGDTDLEVLCIKAGGAALALDGRALAIKTAKPLPSSD
ncbi:hypothetical protein HLB23_13480 [Nocardia uniformis]|uniref:Uncharacterized protein n=1 Tax=Nocardia uniformis TaxID=53432 RepID=A0A849BWC3_9NOCA|nr:hypothetical protein [Nocardia uniformis]NNH70862.1 hypothetical protein [Nocardia uniformis]